MPDRKKLALLEQIRGETEAQTHPIEPTQLKFRWISAGQTERPGNGHRCGSACGGRWSRGDPCPQRPRAAAKAGEKPETDRSAVGRCRDRLGREESYGCWRRRRQGRADDLDRAQGQEGPELNMAPDESGRESRAVRRGTRGRRGFYGSSGRSAEIRDRPRDEGLASRGSRRSGRAREPSVRTSPRKSSRTRPIATSRSAGRHARESSTPTDSAVFDDDDQKS